MVRSIACLLIVTVILAGCSDSASTHAEADGQAFSESASSAIQTGSSVPAANRLVSGNGTKGPLIEATVELFALTPTGGADSSPIASTMTDTQGNWQLNVNRADPILVRISGGSYVDEADTNVDSRRVVQLSADQFLESILFPGETSVAVTVFTQALLEKSRRETAQNDFIDVLETNRQLFLTAYGFDVLGTLPADPLAPSGAADAIAYALNVGGVANAINALSIASDSALPEYEHILAVVEDLVDCRLDGLGIGGQQIISPTIGSYTELSLAQQTLRFRNNNFSAYNGAQPLEINASPCEQLGGSADDTPPAFSAVPQNLQFEADSANGVLLTDAQVDLIASQFTATDERAGTVLIRLDLPALLAIGITDFSAFAEDAWGNVTSTSVQVVVADTTAPQITALLPVDVDAQGTFTPVVLVPPVVSDQVSLPEQIELSNNAPTMFPVGLTEVIWTATDAAGNAATSRQSVTVNSLPPMVTAPPPLLEPDADGVDFSAYFSDPDGTTLTYDISGLPPGTGLSIDPTTGVLSGTPSAADLAAQPLAVTVTATDGQNTVNIQTTVTVVAPNTPPVFSVSADSLILDEDFGSRTLQILPDAVPEAEQDQMVAYSLAVEGIGSTDVAPLDASIDSATQTITLVSRENAHGSVQVTVTANDGQSALNVFTQTISVDVRAVNDVPTTVAGEVIELVAGESFTVLLSDRVLDVEDADLEFTVEQLPSGAGLVGTQISGMALPEDALSDEVPVSVTARDSEGASVNFTVRLQVSNPDQDNDGLTDYEEGLLGFDPLNADSDSDGFGDSLEARLPIEVGQTAIVFVGANGDDNLAGDSPGQALASLEAASERLSMQDSSQPAVILVERQASFDVSDSVVLSGLQRTLLGGVNFDTLQLESDEATVRSTQLASLSSRVILLNGCQDCEIANLRIESGAGIAAIDSRVVLREVQIVATTGVDGSALFLEQSAVTATNLLLAGNRAVRGGAVLLESQSELNLQDSTLTGNKANSGGVVSTTDSVVTLRNVVIAANTAVEGGVIDAIDSDVTITNATIANNTLESLTDENLIRCRNAFLGPCALSAAPLVRDTLIAGNRNLGSRALGLGTVSASSFGLFVEPEAVVPGMTSLDSAEPFAVAYSSNNAITVDAGSQSAVSAALDTHFSETASVFTDQGVVDAGAHYDFPLSRISLFRPVARFTQGHTLPGLRAVDIQLVETDNPLREIRRLAVSSASSDTRSFTISTGVLPESAAGRPGTAVPAISLGDGRYRVWVSAGFNAGRDQLSLWLDDSVLEVKVSVVCTQVLCGAGGTENSAAPGQDNNGLSNERIRPAIQPVAQGG